MRTTKLTTTLHRLLKVGLLALAFLPAATAVLQAQTTSTYIQAAANAQWGNAVNWSPASIPNGTDAVVNLSTVTLYCSNTVENASLSNSITGPNYPYVFGTLNLAPTVVGANTVGNQLRGAVSSGRPVINGNGTIYSRITSDQGIIYQNANTAALLEYRYNTMSNYINGDTEIAGGAVVEINGDYQFGNATNAVIIHDGGTLTSRSSDNSNGPLTIPSWRKILLDATSQYAGIGVYSTYKLIIACPIGEITPGSGLKMWKIPFSTTYSAGPVTLAATNTYTGPTEIDYGTLVVSNQFALMNSTLTPNTGGTVQFDAGITANAFTAAGLAGNGTLTLRNNSGTTNPITLTVGGNNADTTYSGQLLGITQGGTLVKVGTGTLTLSGTADNSYGTINVSNGAVVLAKNSTGSVHANGGGVILNGGTVQLGGSGGDQIFNSTRVTLNSGTFDLNGQTETIAGLAGGGGTNADSTLGTAAILTVNVASGSVTNGSTLTGGNLVFGGAGTQVFVGTDNRDAFVAGLTTTVNAGTLQLGTGGSVIPVGGATGITVNAPGTLSFIFGGTATFTNAINGSGNIAQNSSGTLILAGSDTHSGNTLVNTGTLALPSGGTTVGGSLITVAANATLNVAAGSLTLTGGQTLNGQGTITGSYTVASGATNSGKLTINGNVTLQAGAVLNPGSLTSAGTLTNNGSIINAGGYTLIYNLAATTTPGGGTNALLVVSGNLNVGSAGGGNAAKLLITGSPLNGTYVLATYGTFSGTVGDVQITGVSGRQTYTLQTSGNQLQLVVGGQAAQGIVWLGDGSANVWDANNTLNKDWTNSALSTVDYFAQSDIATFNNASPNLVVNLTGDLLPQPGSAVLVNSTNNYTFTGAGYIDGTTSLTKTNSGTLTIDTANTFTGPVNLNGGVVSVASVAVNGAASPLGAGSTLAFNGGTLQYTGPNANGSAFNRAVTIGTNGATIDQSGSGYLYIAGLISGSGSLTKMGASQLVVSGNNTSYTNITYINNGQVQLNNANALGSGTSLVIVTNTGTSVAAGAGVTGTIPKTFTLAGDGDGKGALQANGTGTAVTFSGAINLVTNASIGGNSTGVSTISGVISGAGALTKLGTANFALAANNTYTGGTVINTGTLQLGTGAGGGNNGWFAPMPASWQLTNNGVLAINHTNNVALTNTITGTGLINQNGAGTLTLGVSNNLTGGTINYYPTIGYSLAASVNVNAGILLVTNSYALGIGVASTTRLQLAGNLNIPAPMVLVSGALGVQNLENLSGTNTIYGQVNGVYGNNYWPIAATGGQLIISTFNDAIGNSTYGRTLQLQGAANGVITNIIDSSSTLVNPSGLNYLMLEKDGPGTWTISGPADVPRNVAVNAGALVIDANGSINAGGASSLLGCTVAGGTLLVNGSMTLSPSVTANVNGGQLGGSGTIGGAVNIGAAGVLSPNAGFSTNTSALTINGLLTLGGNLNIAVNKSLVRSNDLVNVIGSSITNTGTGIVTVTNVGPALVVGDTFNLFNQAVTNGAALSLNSVVRGGLGQYITWSNHLALDGGISVLAAAPLGTNAYLTSLAFNPTDSLTPNFATNGFLYYATNTAGTATTLTVTNASLTASNELILNGLAFQVLTSGVPSLTLTNFGVGSTNVLKVLVTAQDGVTTNLYTVNVTQLTASVNTNTFTIGSSVSGGNLNLSWPPDRLGWKLWVQTNALNAGLGTNWYLWPNSTTVTNVSIPLNPANPSVFLRMTYP